MGLLNKQTLYDILAGDRPVGNLATVSPRRFDKGKDSTIQQDSLLDKYFYTYGDSQEIAGPVPGGDSNSPFQDLNGLQGPQSQLPQQQASDKHTDSLSIPRKVDIDLNGQQGPQFQREKEAASQVHINSLSILPKSSPYQDTNGVVPASQGGNGYFHSVGWVEHSSAGSTVHAGAQLNGVDLHEALLTQAYTKNNVTIGPSPGPSGYSDFQDLDGVKPPTYTNNPPEPGSFF